MDSRHLLSGEVSEGTEAGETVQHWDVWKVILSLLQVLVSHKPSQHRAGSSFL